MIVRVLDALLFARREPAANAVGAERRRPPRRSPRSPRGFHAGLAWRRSPRRRRRRSAHCACIAKAACRRHRRRRRHSRRRWSRTRSAQSAPRTRRTAISYFIVTLRSCGCPPRAAGVALRSVASLAGAKCDRSYCRARTNRFCGARTRPARLVHAPAQFRAVGRRSDSRRPTPRDGKVKRHITFLLDDRLRRREGDAQFRTVLAPEVRTTSAPVFTAGTASGTRPERGTASASAARMGFSLAPL